MTAIGQIPKIPINIKQGGMFYLPIYWLDKNKDPLSLVSYNAQWRAKASPGASEDLFNLKLGSGITFTISTALIEITMTSAISKEFDAPWSGVHNFSLITPGGNYIPLFEGPLTIEAGGIDEAV